MPRKAAVAKAKNPAREANRKARHERREEIEWKWHDRSRLNLFRATLEAGGEQPELSSVVNDILVFGADRGAHFDAQLIREWLDFEKFNDREFYARIFATSLLEIIRLKEMPYDEYLQTSHWKGVAERTKSRFDYTCALDVRHVAIDAHHRTYERRGRERIVDVVPLCRECHELHHKRRS